MYHLKLIVGNRSGFVCAGILPRTVRGETRGIMAGVQVNSAGQLDRQPCSRTWKARCRLPSQRASLQSGTAKSNAMLMRNGGNSRRLLRAMSRMGEPTAQIRATWPHQSMWSEKYLDFTTRKMLSRHAADLVPATPWLLPCRTRCHTKRRKCCPLQSRNAGWCLIAFTRGRPANEYIHVPGRQTGRPDLWDMLTRG